MSHFRTVVSPIQSSHKMGISDKILTIGSCFADTIGNRLQSTKLRALPNPFGVVYNPHSIFKAIRYAIANESPEAGTFLQHQGVFLNYDFHSEVSALQPEHLRVQLKEIIGTSHHFLADAQWLIITLGTAWVYTRSDTSEIVANCHKQPQALFKKSLMTQRQIMNSFDSCYRELMQFNPTIRIILTVSPVRHVKDTLELNSVSKAVLRASCHTIVQEHPEITYFPAYEIMLDDLRDYRFYQPDMIHPSPVAEDYIWEKFRDMFLSPSLKEFIQTWDQIQQAMDHRPFHPRSVAHQAFLTELLKKLETLKETVNVDDEISQIKARLV